MTSVVKKKVLTALSAAMLATIAPAAHAHFQLIYTPDVNIEKAGPLPLRLMFWHPMENGHVMDMEKPQEFFLVTRGEKTDLMPALQEITFKGAKNEAKAYSAEVDIKRNGDYIFVVVPVPYFEKSEDIYIQQITKSFVNKGEIPTGWNKAIGLLAEIVPLNKPTNVLTGSTFSGVVLSEGKPAAGIEIEVEYMAAEPDMTTNTVGKPAAGPAVGGTLVAVTDANGVFTFGIPKAGFWGFAALGAGPVTEHEGKELSQDAVIWIRAYDLPDAD